MEIHFCVSVSQRKQSSEKARSHGQCPRNERGNWNCGLHCSQSASFWAKSLRQQVNDEDAALIAQALWENSNLGYLFLGGNEFTQAGFEPLESAVVGGSTFNSKYSCNHTCKISLSDSGNTHKLNGRSRVENRAFKVYCQFLRQNMDGTNARHLDAKLGGECTPMIPHVLASIGRFYSTLPDDVRKRYVGPLAIVFELARSWKMSEMYNF